MYDWKYSKPPMPRDAATVRDRRLGQLYFGLKGGKAVGVSNAHGKSAKSAAPESAAPEDIAPEDTAPEDTSQVLCFMTCIVFYVMCCYVCLHFGQQCVKVRHLGGGDAVRVYDCWSQTN